ncbi:MAG: hypothetical protein R2730_02400 [Chitinophagales bacterium]
MDNTKELTRTELISGDSDSFNRYLDSVKDQVVNEEKKDYYSVDVVAEAYSQGFSDGEKRGKQDIFRIIFKNKIENFTQKANQIYILSKNTISHLKEHGFKVKSLHINLRIDSLRVVIVVANDLLVDDTFINIAYSKVIDNKKIYDELFDETLDIGLISGDNLDEDLLVEDGFGYIEKY